MNDETILRVANRIAAPYGLRADFLGDAYAVGVTGDFRAYTRVIVLTGPFPGHAALASVSTAISNETGISRVGYDVTSGFAIEAQRAAHLRACTQMIADLKEGLRKRGMSEAEANVRCPECKHTVGFVADTNLAEKWVDHVLMHESGQHPPI